MTFLQVPITNSAYRMGGLGDVVLLDQPRLPAVFAAMKDNLGQPTAPAATTTRQAGAHHAVGAAGRRPVQDPGTGRERLGPCPTRDPDGGRPAQARLHRVISGNATKIATTTVYYGTGKADSARTLAAAVPGAVTKPKASLGSTLELVLGDNFTTTQAVTVAGSTTKAAPTTTTAAKPTTSAPRGSAGLGDRREGADRSLGRLRAVTPASLLSQALSRDSARPFLTFYDDATGERVELSVATYANWVFKTANMLQDGLAAEPGARVAVMLPAHWQTSVILCLLGSGTRRRDRPRGHRAG